MLKKLLFSAVLIPSQLYLRCHSTRSFIPRHSIPIDNDLEINEETRSILREKAKSAKNYSQMIYQLQVFYIPLHQYILKHIHQIKENNYNQTVIVGISAPQVWIFITYSFITKSYDINITNMI
jgi:hypothetical protein